MLPMREVGPKMGPAGAGEKFNSYLKRLRAGGGGEGGIRTHGALPGTPHFECGTFDHSATSPQVFFRELFRAARVEGAITSGVAAGTQAPPPGFFRLSLSAAESSGCSGKARWSCPSSRW